MKDQKNNGDRSKNVLWFTLTIIAILTLTSFIPPTKLYRWQLKRVNLLENIVDFNDPIVSDLTSKDIIDTTSLSELSMSTIIEMDSASKKSSELDTFNNNETNDSIFAHNGKYLARQKRIQKGIEDYSPHCWMVNHISETLLNESKKRKVRIAFLGDSFIEGDILTSKFRKLLQKEYGGEGIGFIPFADPTNKNRPTIMQEYGNWTRYNLLRKKNAPQYYKNDFFVSGYLSIPKEGAYAKFSSKNNGNSIIGKSVKILFKNRSNGTMTVTINNSKSIKYILQNKNEVQQIEIVGFDIKSLAIHLHDCNNFIGYGVIFEGDNGVYVDNYGLRSNSGLNIFSTGKNINQQISRIQKYDLIVLEYGLNALQKDITDYHYYANKIERVIDYVKVCFPESAIMVLSIGDVGMKVDDKVITAPAVESMVKSQRIIAKNSNVTFWNMYKAMGGENSIKEYVDNGWAEKDYMHINHKGGNAIALLLMKDINEEVKLFQKE